MKLILKTLLTIILFLSSCVVQAEIKTISSSLSSSPFKLNYYVDNEKEELHLMWDIKKDYHLYKKEVDIKNGNLSIDIKEEDIKSKSYVYHDKFKGDVEVFDYELVIVKPLKELLTKDNLNLNQKFLLEINYQGCGKDICFPKKTEKIDLTNIDFFKTLIKNPQITNFKKTFEINEINNDQFLKNTQDPKENKSEIKKNIEKNEYFQYFNGWGILFFFILGIGLTFTPCVLPMLPLLSKIIVNNKNENISKKQVFILSLSYVQGMALTYTLLGLLVASFGLKFSIFFQSNEVLVGISLLFIILALSNFGLFNINMPNIFGLKDKINQINQNLTGGNVIKTFLMGVVAGLVASPCVSAPLSGILLYVAQRGDLFTGGIALYLLALGIGFPLILISIFGKGLLPKTGEWMIKVKTLFGFILLLFPCVLLTRVFLQNNKHEWLFFGILGIIFFYWIINILIELKIKKKQEIDKYFNIRFHLILTVILFGFCLSAIPLINSTTYFYHSYFLNSNEINKKDLLKTNDSIFNSFTKINDLKNIKNIIQDQENQNKLIVVDFYADWCTSCKDVENNLNTIKIRDKIVNLLKQDKIVLLKIDVSKNSKENEEIMRHFDIIGMPSMLFIKNNEVFYKKTGVIKVEEMFNHLII